MLIRNPNWSPNALGSSRASPAQAARLDTLVAVAQCGSMAKAAARLAMSQPAVSMAIADIEQTLGVRLLDRTAQGVEPNLYGRALLKWAAAVFDDVRQGINEIEFLADPTAGELRIGATEPMIAGLLPVALERLRRQYPRLVVLRDARSGSLATVPRIAGAQCRSHLWAHDKTDCRGCRTQPSCSMSAPLSWPRRTIRGRGAARSSFPNWSTSLGCYPRPRASWHRSLQMLFAQRDWMFRAPRCFPVHSSSTAASSPPGLTSRYCQALFYDWRKAPVAESLAGRFADPALACRDRYAEETHHQPGGAALHRMRPRGRKTSHRQQTADNNRLNSPPLPRLRQLFDQVSAHFPICWRLRNMSASGQNR